MRPVEVIVTGNVAGLRSALSSGRTMVRDFNNDVQRSAAKRQGITDLGNAYGKVGLVAGAGAVVAVKSYADFDQQMSAVIATGQDAIRNQQALRQASLDAGAASKFNATESAAAVEELLKGSVKARDVLGGGLRGSLNLAAAGTLDVAEAANITATTLTQFKLRGSDAEHVADLLAAAAGKAQGEVTDMGSALKYVGPVASQMNVPLEETVGTIALLANNGILADQAGTSMRGMLMSLTSPSKIASKEMKTLGIEVYDSQGKFVGFEGVAGQLQKRMKDLTAAERDAAFGRIFGNEQITAARILYDGGADAVQNWTNKVDDSGYAADVAKTKMDNLKGDIEQLGGALETALIGTGEGGDTGLRKVTQELTDLVNGYNDLPDPIQNATLKGLALTAALGVGGYVTSKSIVGYANLRNSLEDLGISQDKITKRQMLLRGGLVAGGIALASFSGEISKTDEGLGTLASTAAGAMTGFAFGGPVGAAAGALVGLASSTGESTAAFDSGRASADEYAASMDGVTGAVTRATRAQVFDDLSKTNAIKAAKALGIAQRDIVGYVLGQEGATKRVDRALKDAKATLEDNIPDNTPMVPLPDGGATDAYNALSQSLSVVGDEFDKGHKKALEAARATATWNEALAGIPKDVRTELKNLNYDPTIAELEGLKAKYDLQPKQMRIILRALDRASDTMDDVDRKRRSLDGSVANILINRELRDTYTKVYGGSAPSKKQKGMSDLEDMLTGPVKNANGGLYPASYGQSLVRRYANGGHENHVAQMGSGLVSRVWNEPETGGESYIPHAPSKRARSLKIWEETGRILGVRGFADGGVAGGAGGPAASDAPLLGRLVDNRVRPDKEGIFRLIDDRFELLSGGQDNYAAAGRRAGRS